MYLAFLYVSSEKIEGSCHLIHPFQSERVNKAPLSSGFLVAQPSK